MNDLGLSGCKLELISNRLIRKYSSSKNYNYRLILQADKQEFFSNNIFTNIDTPTIVKRGVGDLYYFDMEYISGCDYYQYFSNISPNHLQKILISLDEYFNSSIKNSHQYNSEYAKDAIHAKLLSFRDTRYLFLIEFVSNYLKSIDVNIRKSFCHGDLTLSNILFHPKKIYFIDFLDSYIDSFLLDLVKLKQDLYYYWILKFNNKKSMRIVQSFNYIWKHIENMYDEYLNLEVFQILDLINFLRIEPYLTNEKQRLILDNIIKKTYLYGEFTRTYGGEVIQIS